MVQPRPVCVTIFGKRSVQPRGLRSRSAGGGRPSIPRSHGGVLAAGGRPEAGEPRGRPGGKGHGPSPGRRRRGARPLPGAPAGTPRAEAVGPQETGHDPQTARSLAGAGAALSEPTGTGLRGGTRATGAHARMTQPLRHAPGCPLATVGKEVATVTSGRNLRSQDVGRPPTTVTHCHSFSMNAVSAGAAGRPSLGEETQWTLSVGGPFVLGARGRGGRWELGRPHTLLRDG